MFATIFLFQPKNISVQEPENTSVGEPENISAGEPENTSAKEPDNTSVGEPDITSVGEPEIISVGEQENTSVGDLETSPLHVLSLLYLQLFHCPQREAGVPKFVEPGGMCPTKTFQYYTRGGWGGASGPPTFILLRNILTPSWCLLVVCPKHQLVSL